MSTWDRIDPKGLVGWALGLFWSIVFAVWHWQSGIWPGFMLIWTAVCAGILIYRIWFKKESNNVKKPPNNVVHLNDYRQSVSRCDKSYNS